jgi:D-alanyl-lipoteichoic acid acyltransferase DltB (MBOAT superfamily)
LYLQISGQFHLITGMLHLFGFNLPETNHLYFLAESFTDFWRRINVYWKDYVTKLVYFPTLFRLRRWGERSAVVLSTLFVFFMTWLLHSYQWFWLRGSFPLVWTEVLFWGILGILAAINGLYEVRQRHRRTVSADPRSLRSVGARVLRTAATFAVICTLWSLWTAESVSEWIALWSFLGAR